MPETRSSDTSFQRRSHPVLQKIRDVLPTELISGSMAKMWRFALSYNCLWIDTRMSKHHSQPLSTSLLSTLSLMNDVNACGIHNRCFFSPQELAGQLLSCAQFCNTNYSPLDVSLTLSDRKGYSAYETLYRPTSWDVFFNPRFPSLELKPLWHLRNLTANHPIKYQLT